MKSKKYIYVIILLVAIIVSYFNMLSLERVIVDNIVKLESYFVKSPIIFMIAFFSSYVLLTALSIPVALLLGLLSGFIFDTFTAVVIISFASSIGATAAMLVSRYLIKDYINLKFNKQVLIINSELDIHGAYYLFALRMSPVFPFFIINAAFGLTNIKAWVFYIISQLGMLPGTIIIILIGSELDKFIIDQGPFEFDLIVYLTLFGLIPLIFKKYGMK